MIWENIAIICVSVLIVVSRLNGEVLVSSTEGKNIVLSNASRYLIEMVNRPHLEVNISIIPRIMDNHFPNPLLSMKLDVF